MRKPYGASNSSPFASPEKKRGRKGNFSLNIHATDANSPEKKEFIEPQVRCSGGVWVATSDLPYSFQNFIVYHNITKMNHV